MARLSPSDVNGSSFVAATGSGESPRVYLERCIARIEEIEPDVQAFTASNIQAARTAADASALRWEAGHPLSPIDGMPIGVKDIIETKDFPTEMGSPLFSGWRAGCDAASVSALREAGAIVVGKTVTTEFAATVPGSTRNPHDLSRTPGGSSSGSAAAVGSGMLAAALGTQVVGSIIRPASYCGCVGFKPTVGALNRGGSHDFFSQSCLGVLAQTLGDAWAVAREIAQRVGGDPGSVALSERTDPFVGGKPRSVAVLETGGWSHVSDDVKALFQQWLSQLSEAGVRVVTRRELPELDVLERALSDALELTRCINAWESRWPLKAYRALGDGLSDVLLDRLVIAEKMSVAQYTDAVARREAVRRLHSSLHGKCDALVTLSAPDCAPVGLASTGDPAFAVPASLLGAPAVSVPLLKAHGLPLGIQVIGFQACDSDMFGIARWLASRHAGMP